MRPTEAPRGADSLIRVLLALDDPCGTVVSVQFVDTLFSVCCTNFFLKNRKILISEEPKAYNRERRRVRHRMDCQDHSQKGQYSQKTVHSL